MPGEQFTQDDDITPEEALAREDKGDALMKYAMLLADAEAKRSGSASGQHVENVRYMQILPRLVLELGCANSHLFRL